ncbi:MAG TPA: hypothetical protein VJ742_10800 [Nitrososphaera sp.]|jgi:hypothetical protein|nr:hypothetical protein [Nitrososphaera sp.]
MPYYAKKKRFPLRPVYITSAVSIFIFAMIYGLIEHMLLASPIGLSVLTYPMSIHLAGQLYFYHVIMLIMAMLVSFNPFFDRLIFRTNRSIRLQGIFWGTGNILNFIWLEDLFYWVLFGEWPKDVMTPLHISFYGVVWWYPVAFGGALFLYYLTSRIIRKMPIAPEQHDR